MDMEEEVGIMHIVINSNNHSKKYIVDPPQITYNEGFKKKSIQKYFLYFLFI